MGYGKTYRTKWLEDLSGNQGTANQVLISTSTGIAWSDVSSLPGAGIWVASGNDIYNSNSGNVGIGTANPNSTLQVDGEIDVSGGDGYRINGKPWAYESSDNLQLGDWDGEGFSTSIYDNNSSEVIRVTNGKVGIGTTSPSTKLHVDGSITADTHFTSSDTNVTISTS